MITIAIGDFVRFNLIPLVAICNTGMNDHDEDPQGVMKNQLMKTKLFVFITSVYPPLIVLIILYVFYLFGT
jgi:hypothetical protein